MFDLTIRHLIDENYIYARALSYLGVEFYLYPDRRLREVCEAHGLEKSRVLKTFYLFDRSHRFSFKELSGYPLEIVLEYLKHSHHLFIKDKLPYIARLVSRYDHNEDLRLIFPEFVEDFIKHIYDEEDTLFKYVELLLSIDKGLVKHPLAVFWKNGRVDVHSIHAEHAEEDELAGIRTLIEETTDASIHWQVISRELKAFDREMWYHAEIENKILFPKVIDMEHKVLEKLQRLISLS